MTNYIRLTFRSLERVVASAIPFVYGSERLGDPAPSEEDIVTKQEVHDPVDKLQLPECMGGKLSRHFVLAWALALGLEDFQQLVGTHIPQLMQMGETSGLLGTRIRYAEQPVPNACHD